MLELGAGTTGLPGLVAARLLGSPLVLTDLPEQLAALQRSAALNGVAARAEAYAWGEATELRGGLVLAADVLYDTEAVEPLVEALEKVSEPWGLCLVAFDTALGRWGAYNTFLDIIEGRWTVALWRPFEGSRSGCRRGFEAFRVIFRLSRDVLRPSKELLAEKMQLEGFRKPSVQVYCLSERAFLRFQAAFGAQDGTESDGGSWEPLKTTRNGHFMTFRVDFRPFSSRREAQFMRSDLWQSQGDLQC